MKGPWTQEVNVLDIRKNHFKKYSRICRRRKVKIGRQRRLANQESHCSMKRKKFPSSSFPKAFKAEMYPSTTSRSFLLKASTTKKWDMKTPTSPNPSSSTDLETRTSCLKWWTTLAFWQRQSGNTSLLFSFQVTILNLMERGGHRRPYSRGQKGIFWSTSEASTNVLRTGMWRRWW